MMSETSTEAVLFALEPHSLFYSLCKKLELNPGFHSFRRFPDNESYLRVETSVKDKHCIILADLSHPDSKCLHLLFMAETLRELGAASVGLIAPYLCYLRQDKRFVAGEAVTSRIFASLLSQHVDWLVTVDPHLHRYHSLNEVYSIPCRVVHGGSLLATWLASQQNVLLVGPDAESEQWVAQVSEQSGHPYVIGEKQRLGDREVVVTLPDLDAHQGCSVVIIDDVISSGHTLIQCIDALQKQQFDDVSCAAIHGIFVGEAEERLKERGIRKLVTTNSIPHHTNEIDLSESLVIPVSESLIEIDELGKK
ncbi:ribose-phosphate diphosphokinase [Photobacterium sp. J15]|uniref:ribose-phosphate diphosphokinase n=1 Tax=Photobacterium sp. J15 TaxID=265901 RepID=UPI0007E363A3|nr:ribose-phosphate diphosphokinase [Photobacterium sp. J15]